LLDKAGTGLYADFRLYYGIDLVEAVESGTPSPRFLLALVRGLPDGCWTQALLAEMPELRGWTREMSLMADVFDNISVNTVATGFGKSRRPYLWPGRPGVKQTFAAEKVSVKGVRQMFVDLVSG
jgi:hypothetical protein